ncbi:MAG: hypothetical protein HUU46_14905 [Candidatus Hydrogenedentes bacterium]|nr:hypothetical protein [Candidatus Hydrogenedentota bacterium]
MCPDVSRRQFLGCSAVGGALLMTPLAASARSVAAEEGWIDRPPVKIHTVYVGRTGDIYLSRPTEEIAKFKQYLAGIEQKLGDVKFVGGETVPPEDVATVVAKMADADGVLMFHLSGHGGGAPQEAMQRIVEVGLPTAVFTQPFSGHGWMYFPQWQKEGKKVVLLPTSDWGELERISALMRVPARLKQTRIMVVRGPMGTPAACSAEQVKQKFGAALIPVTVEQTIEAFNAVDVKAAEAEAEKYWIRPAKDVVEPTRDEVIAAARFYLALKNMMMAHKAAAITSSNCMGDPAKGCLAFSKLNDMGYVGACEGDMDSTLTMLMFAYAFGVPGFISDPVVDTARNALIHFHCTSATKMDGAHGKRRPFTIRTQTDSHRGVSLDVENRIGQEVTCAKLVNLDSMLISTGKIIDVTHDKLGCRTQFVTEVKDANSIFENWGAGLCGKDAMTLLHRVVFYGNYTKSMKDLGTLTGFKVIEEGPSYAPTLT